MYLSSVSQSSAHHVQMSTIFSYFAPTPKKIVNSHKILRITQIKQSHTQKGIKIQQLNTISSEHRSVTSLKNFAPIIKKHIVEISDLILRALHTICWPHYKGPLSLQPVSLQSNGLHNKCIKSKYPLISFFIHDHFICHP